MTSRNDSRQQHTPRLAIGTKVRCARCKEFLGTVGRKKPIQGYGRKDGDGIYCSQACAVMAIGEERLQAIGAKSVLLGDKGNTGSGDHE